MFIRQLASCTVVAGLFLVAAVTTYAEKSHEGKVVSVTQGAENADGKLVMTDEQGKNQHTHPIASTVKTTRNGKAAKLGDLKKGDAITVTTNDDGKVTELAAETKTDSNGSSDKTASSEKNGLPDLLKDLKLTSEQQNKINDITREYDGDCESAWTEFSDLYRSEIRIEASMLAAIEEHFNEGQRKHLHHQRHKMVQKDKSQADKGDTAANRDKSSEKKPSDEKASDNDASEEDDIVIIGITLTPEQQESAHSTRRNYLDRLRSVDEAIESVHARMISLETERLLEIEKVLTKEQRTQLRKGHQRLTRASKETADEKSSK